jgi:hypothetical protein
LIIHIISSEFLAIPKNLEGALRRRGSAIDWPIIPKGCRIFDANDILLNVLHLDGDYPVAHPHSLRIPVTELHTKGNSSRKNCKFVSLVLSFLAINL